jgi:hypothetical protein
VLQTYYTKIKVHYESFFYPLHFILQSSGEHILLTPVISIHEIFVKWEYRDAQSGVELDEMWINGNVFAMPANNVIVRAVTDPKQYTLNVYGASLVGKSGQAIEGNGTQYTVGYDSLVTLSANPAPAGKMLVGWDYKTRDNRVNGISKTYSFRMPGENISVWAIYGTVRPMGIRAEGPSGFNDAEAGFKLITDGKVAGAENPDPLLEGMSGYRLAIPVNTAVGSYHDVNIGRANEFTTYWYGSQTVKVIFRNHSEVPIALEFFVNSYWAVAGTGTVIVPANGTAEGHFIANMGYNNANCGVIVKDPITGATGTHVLVDMVVQKAETWPEGGDIELRTSGAEEPQWLEWGGPVKVGTSHESESATMYYASGISNELGIFVEYRHIKMPETYISFRINNMPAYDETNAKTRIYFRLFNANAYEGSGRFNVGFTDNPLEMGPDGESNALAYYDFTIEGGGVILFAIDVPRDANEKPFYMSYIKSVKEAHDMNLNFVVQMAYNNVFGMEETTDEL